MERCLREMQKETEQEKQLLESQLKNVIHSQAGKLASQKQKISQLQSALQGELTVSKNKIAEQEKEITWLKR